MHTIRRGRTWEYRATFYAVYKGEGHPDNVPFNLTGQTLRMHIRTKIGHKLIARVPISSPVPTSGVIVGSLDRGQTKALKEGDYIFDIIRTDSTPNDYVLRPKAPIRVVTDPTDPTDNGLPPSGGGGGGGAVHIDIDDVTGLQDALDDKQDAFTAQAANRVFAGPPLGAAAVPTFRALVPADIPAIARTKVVDVDVRSTRMVNANTTVVAGDHTIRVNAASGPVTVFLPPALTVAGRVFNIKKIDATANAVTIDADGSDLIDGQGTIQITTQFNSYSIQSNGLGWDTI